MEHRKAKSLTLGSSTRAQGALRTFANVQRTPDPRASSPYPCLPPSSSGSSFSEMGLEQLPGRWTQYHIRQAGISSTFLVAGTKRQMYTLLYHRLDLPLSTDQTPYTSTGSTRTRSPAATEPWGPGSEQPQAACKWTKNRPLPCWLERHTGNWSQSRANSDLYKVASFGLELDSLVYASQTLVCSHP